MLAFLLYLLRLRRYKAKGVKTRCYQEAVGQFERRFQGEVVVPEEQFFGFYKNRHILLSDSANCTVLRAVVLTQYRRVTDGQTEGIAVASAALAKRRAVKMREVFFIGLQYRLWVSWRLCGTVYRGGSWCTALRCCVFVYDTDVCYK